MQVSVEWNDRAEQFARQNGEASDKLYNEQTYNSLISRHEKDEYLSTHYRINCLFNIDNNDFTDNVEVKIFAVPCKISKTWVHNPEFPLTTAYIKQQYLKYLFDSRNSLR